MNEIAFDNNRAVNEIILPAVAKDRKVKKLASFFDEKTDSIKVTIGAVCIATIDKVSTRVVMLNEMMDEVYTGVIATGY